MCCSRSSTLLVKMEIKCGICDKLIHNSSISVHCKLCDRSVHINCNFLTFRDLQFINFEAWNCFKCNCDLFPFNTEFSRSFNCDIDFLNDANSLIHSWLLDSEYIIDCRYYDYNSFISSNFSDTAMSFFHLNISSLPKHFDNLLNLFDSLQYQFKVIGISETRISDSNIGSHNVEISGYSSIFTNTVSQAGGTALYLHNSINFKPRSDLSSILNQDTLIESTFAEIHHAGQQNTIVGCIYKHPGFPIHDFNNLIRQLLNLVNIEGKRIVLLGDFNINISNFETDSSIAHFVDILESFMVVPSITCPTRVTANSSSLIDNIFISANPQKVFSGNLLTAISDHLPQFLIHDSFSVSNLPNTSGTYRDWVNFNRDDFILDFLDKDWNLVINSMDSNQAFQLFINSLTSLIDKHAPIKKLTKKQLKSSLKPWITKGIKTSIYQRDKIFKLFLKCKDENLKSEYHHQYKNYRNRITGLIRTSKRIYFKNFFQANINNSKHVWQGINSLINSKSKRSSDKISLNDNNNGNLISDPSNVANKFNEFFTSIANSIRDTIPESNKDFRSFLKNRPRNSFFFKPVESHEVMKIIKSLKINKASGPSSIPPEILKLLLNDISNILAKIFNSSFLSGEFPKCLKIVKVIPVFKNKGSPLEVTNYRPISLLSNIDKIFEKIVHSRLTSFLNANNVLFNKQFGFRSKHSTSHALVSLTESIRSQLDAGNFSCSVFIDLQKAFDTVDHEILIAKLHHYGIRGLASNWFKTYLSNRLQFVSISGKDSSLLPISHGVPQGSVLGPLLFLIYINDMPNAFRFCDTFLFADDTSLLLSDKNINTLESNLNIDLEHLSMWLISNKISINATKTETLFFKPIRKLCNSNPSLYLSGQALPLSTNVKYLGIILDDKLSWTSHINSLASKLSKANGIISKLRHFLPQDTLLSIYYAFFFSHATYALSVWGQSLPANSRIITLQKTAIRLITFSNFRAHSKPLFKTLKLLTITDLVFFYNILLIHQILNNTAPSYIQNTFNLSLFSGSIVTRQHSKILSLPAVSSKRYGINSVIFQSILNWNTLQSNFKTINLASLKLSKLKAITMNNILSSYE